jgi:hypothetical protein
VAERSAGATHRGDSCLPGCPRGLKGANIPIHHAAASYSWMGPPRRSRRRSFTGNAAPERMVWPPSGVSRSSPRWGLPRL